MGEDLLGWTDAEKVCVRVLAKLYVENAAEQINVRFVERLAQAGYRPDPDLPLRVVLDLFLERGAIAGMTHPPTGIGYVEYFASFKILPHAVILAHQLKRQEKEAAKPGDVVTAIINRARANTVFAFLFVAFIFTAAVLTTLHQGYQALQDFHVVGQREPGAPAAAPPINVNPTIQMPPAPEPKFILPERMDR